MSETPILANDTVTAAVHALLGLRQKRQKDLATFLQFDSGTMSRAMNGKRRWTVEDLFRMAGFFDCEYAAFFTPADEMMAEGVVRSRCSLFGDLEPLPEVA